MSSCFPCEIVFLYLHASSNPGRRISFSRVNFVCWIIFSVSFTRSGNELTHNSSGNTQPQSSQLPEPMWTDPGLKSGIDVCKLIFTLRKKKHRWGINGWTFSPNSRKQQKRHHYTFMLTIRDRLPLSLCLLSVLPLLHAFHERQYSHVSSASAENRFSI